MGQYQAIKIVGAQKFQPFFQPTPSTVINISEPIPAPMYDFARCSRLASAPAASSRRELHTDFAPGRLGVAQSVFVLGSVWPLSSRAMVD
jgi:hypothetical protein